MIPLKWVYLLHGAIEQLSIHPVEQSVVCVVQDLISITRTILCLDVYIWE